MRRFAVGEEKTARQAIGLPKSGELKLPMGRVEIDVVEKRSAPKR